MLHYTKKKDGFINEYCPFGEMGERTKIGSCRCTRDCMSFVGKNDKDKTVTCLKDHENNFEE